MDNVYLGPTVTEAAEYRIRQINKQIEELQQEKRACILRAAKHRGSTMLECERVATEAERFLPPIEGE